MLSIGPFMATTIDGPEMVRRARIILPGSIVVGQWVPKS